MCLPMPFFDPVGHVHIVLFTLHHHTEYLNWIRY